MTKEHFIGAAAMLLIISLFFNVFLFNQVSKSIIIPSGIEPIGELK